MSSLIPKYSKFYYGTVVDSDNQFLDFKEGAGPELTATLRPGEYTLTDLAIEIQRALEDEGALDYDVFIDRTQRTFTILPSGPVDLLLNTGSHFGTSAYPLIGFTSGVDILATTSSTSLSPIGSEYVPQFILQSYIDSNDWQEAADASVNKTASGVVEVIKFGLQKFFQFDILYVTDIPQPCGGPILNNPTGLQDLRNFMRYCITRAPLGFMPDKDLPNTFYKIILETTTDSSDGVGYKLKELYDKNLPGYWDAGITKWRLIE